MERFFNTAGPNRPEEQYTIDPLSRFDFLHLRKSDNSTNSIQTKLDRSLMRPASL